MANATRRHATRKFWVLGWLMLILLIAASSIRGFTREQRLSDGSATREGEESTLDGDLPAPAQRREKFLVTIRRPEGPPVIQLRPGTTDRGGQVACSTCHSARAANRENRRPSDFKQFHQDMSLTHGELACYACHNPDDSDTLRLADGNAVEYTDVMNLCAQCHGRQSKSYARGSHGGMTGYWDLSRGGRVRNNCIDCHDPHVPRFPRMQPTFKPRDRFLTPSASDESHDTTD